MNENEEWFFFQKKNHQIVVSFSNNKLNPEFHQKWRLHIS